MLFRKEDMNFINNFESNEVKKYLINYQRLQRYAGVGTGTTRIQYPVGYARKSAGWMPWH